jgi:hypothetical protein
VPEAAANELDVLAAVAELSQKSKTQNKSRKKKDPKVSLFKGGLAFFVLGNIPKAFDVWEDPTPSKKKRKGAAAASMESPESAAASQPSPDSPALVNLATMNPVQGPPSATKSKSASAFAEAQKSLTEMKNILGGLSTALTSDKKLQAIREKIKDLSEEIKEFEAKGTEDDDDLAELAKLKAELKKSKELKRAMLTELTE